MRTSAMGADIEFLRDWLEDEFSSSPEVRIHLVLPATTSRALDLEQDYDPASGMLHVERGVRVALRGREYFFPADWAREMSQAYQLVSTIREYLGE